MDVLEKTLYSASFENFWSLNVMKCELKEKKEYEVKITLTRKECISLVEDITDITNGRYLSTPPVIELRNQLNNALGEMK